MGLDVLVAACLLGLGALGAGSDRRLMAVMRRRAAPPAGRAPGLMHRPGRGRSALPAAAVTVPSALALELRAGRDLSSALTSVADEHEDLPELSARLRQAAGVGLAGGDVGGALAGRQGEHEGVGAALRVTAACCGSAASAGLPIADLLDSAAAAARAGATLQGMARAELAGTRSTAAVLAVLPLAGIAMGQLLGARPLAVLVGTGWGAGCLVGATALTAAGLLWMRAITAGVRRSVP
ncbi:MAG: tight adherence protein [Frankiales bacterium]|jgi:tight adherence protein B|nr:tight adherence protein [Frankiales bacterium]